MDLSPGRPSTEQNDIGPQAFDLALDIIHPAERQDLMTVKPDQVCKRPSLMTVIPSLISQHAAPRYLSTTWVLRSAVRGFCAAEASTAAVINTKDAKTDFSTGELGPRSGFQLNKDA